MFGTSSPLLWGVIRRHCKPCQASQMDSRFERKQLTQNWNHRCLEGHRTYLADSPTGEGPSRVREAKHGSTLFRISNGGQDMFAKAGLKKGVPPTNKKRTVEKRGHMGATPPLHPSTLACPKFVAVATA